MEAVSDPDNGCCPDPGNVAERDVRSAPPSGTHVACHRFNVHSDPPEAHIYADGNYWGKTGLDKPVKGYYWCAVAWNEQERKWHFTKNSVFGKASVLKVTFTAKRVNSSDATQVVELRGQDFQVESASPEELTASGLFGKCPPANPAYTSDVMVVLQSGDIISG